MEVSQAKREGGDERRENVERAPCAEADAMDEACPPHPEKYLHG